MSRSESAAILAAVSASIADCNAASAASALLVSSDKSLVKLAIAVSTVVST